MPILTPFLMRLLVVVAIGLGLVGFGAYLASRHYAPLLKAEHDERISFQAGVAALGKAAQKRTDDTNAANLKRKQDADAEHAKTVAGLDRTIAKLRLDADNARPSGLPSPPSGSSRPDLLCLDRAEYQRADGEANSRLRQGARSLADEGTASTVDLNTAKGWAAGR